MARKKRQWIREQDGSFHIISHTTGGVPLFEDDEKEYFLKQLKRFSEGFFVEIHAYCIMGNHFHIHATERKCLAEKADDKELLRRYRLMYEKYHEPPPGSYEWDGTLIPDEDGGIQRLRNRLGSISRFVQELKQTFSRWYNKKHKRKGTLWGERFKGIIVERGEFQLICSTYIDLNPVRAGIVKRPEDYRWSSLALRVGNPGKAKKLLTLPIDLSLDEALERSAFEGCKNLREISWYREFIYTCGGIKVEGKGAIPPDLVDEVRLCHGRLGIKDKFRYRVKNMSEGIALGSYDYIASIQKKLKRKSIRPQEFLDKSLVCTT